MINRLINMDFKIPTHNEIISSNGKYTISQYATIFLNGLGETQKERFKKMLQNGIKSGMSVADSYGIDYEQFIKEVKSQLNIKEEK